MARRALITIRLLLICCAGIAGCAREVVFVHLTPPQKASEGTLYLASDKAVRVGVVGTDQVFEMTGGAGLLLIPEMDWAAMLAELKRLSASTVTRTQ